MHKWYDEEYEFTVEVTGFLRGDKTEHYCRNGEQIGDIYHCTYGCPVNGQGYGICSKTMMMLYPIMEAVRSGGDLTNIGGFQDHRLPGRVCDVPLHRQAHRERKLLQGKVFYVKFPQTPKRSAAFI